MFFLLLLNLYMFIFGEIYECELCCRQMFDDAALGDLNIEMVEVARSVGAASKFTGSGGAVVAYCPDGPSQVELLEDACKKSGFSIVPVKVVPSLLNEFDIRALSSTTEA